MKHQKALTIIISIVAVLFLALAVAGIELFRNHRRSQAETEIQKDSTNMAQANCDLYDIVTTEGTIRIKLYDKTPKHRDNFRKLVSEHYYDSLLFHRVINGFMIQTGDPYTRDSSKADLYGQGGPGYTVPAEFVGEYWHKKGAVAAARRGDIANPKKSSSGSQFYIVQDQDNCLHLDGQYTVFGETVEGLDVIDRIAAVPVDRYDRPVNDVRIIKVVPVVTAIVGTEGADSVGTENGADSVRTAAPEGTGAGATATDGSRAAKEMRVAEKDLKPEDFAE